MSRPVQVVMFGGQGAGKGTQAKRLAESFGAELIGAGDLLRGMAREDTPSGRKIAGIIETGQLVPDQMISEIISLQLESLSGDQGFILEGYPRTLVQAEQLKEILERLGRTSVPTVFVKLDVPREIQKQRLLARGRHDDTEKLIEERLRIYEEQTTPILSAVESWAPVIHVNGNQEVAAVTNEITKHLEDVKAKA